jgi:hypothetical protein
MQSDGASNFKDWTMMMDNVMLAAHLVSEAGMGKDEVDTNSANEKNTFRRLHDEGKDRLNAKMYYEQACDNPHQANTSVLLNVDVASEKKNELRKVYLVILHNYYFFYLLTEYFFFSGCHRGCEVQELGGC